MKQDKCAICGKTKNLENHHIIPKVDGGTDDETNFLTLCSEHHALMHGIELTRDRKCWGNPNKIKKGDYRNTHIKRNSDGRFAKQKTHKIRKLIYLSKEEWEWIDTEKKKYKCGSGAVVSILIGKYSNKRSKNPLEEILWNSKTG